MKPDSLKDFVLDQLRDLRDMQCRSMFGGFGLYASERFFGILHQGRLYFKTNTATRAAYLQQGMSPFQPNARQKLAAYYEVPANVIEDRRELELWAGEAVRIAGQ